MAANTAPTFLVGNIGRVTTSFGGSSYALGQSVAVQADGKILLGGYTNGSGTYDFALVRYTSNGNLDTSFDGDGKLTTDFATNAVSYEQAYSVAMQADGKIVLGGYSTPDLALARYNSDGSLDTSFDGDGKLTTKFGSSVTGNERVVLQPDGKILVGGTNSADFALARYNIDGSLDATFDSDGKVTTNFGSGSYVAGGAIALQKDGKILRGGGYSANFGPSTDFALARYNADGSLDTSFDGDGKLTTNFGSATASANSATIQADGKILLAGYIGTAGGVSQDFALARYNIDGSLDATFDSDGKVTTNFGASSTGNSVIVQSDGKILVGGSIATGGSDGGDFALARYNSDGSLDASFDGDGKLTTHFFASDSGWSIALQADSKILLGGTSDLSNFALARYNTDGSLDTSFSPQINTLDGSPKFIEPSTSSGSSGVVLAANAQVLDADLAATGNYKDGVLTVSRHGGANTQDVFSASSSGTLTALPAGSSLSVNGVTVGSVVANSAGTLTVVFNTNATQSLVNLAMQQIAYANTSDAPPATVQIDWTFNDGNTGAQGTGGALSVTGSTTVQITATNDLPVLVRPLSEQNLAPSSLFTYTVPADTFGDPDLESLSYSVRTSNGTVIPTWLSFNASTRTFSGTPTSTDAGALDLQVTAKDSANASVSGAFRVTVFPPQATLTGTSASEAFTSGPANDSVDGGAGIDTVVYGISRSNFALAKTSAGFTLTDNSGATGIDALQNVERIKFSDGGIALDVGATQPAGQTVLLLGAVLPGRLVFDATKQALLGAAIDLFDQGYSLQILSGAVTRLPIWDILTGKATPTTNDIATYLLTNVNGVAPDATTLANAVTSLNAETSFATQGNFLWHVAESSTNQTHVGLVGLTATGLAYGW